MKNKILFFIIAISAFEVAIVANNSKDEIIVPSSANNRKIHDEIKKTSFRKMDNGQTLVTNTWERSCAFGGYDNCQAGSYSETIVL